MKEWFLKPAAEWSLADLKGVVTQEIPEGPQLELKQGLPLKDGAKGWVAKRQIHPSERDGLAKEIVALANMYGGNILVGVAESDDTPKRARALEDPMPDINDLAERLRASLSSTIEPPIHGLSIAAVLSDDDTGTGYLVVSVPQSISAPHGFGKPTSAYIRRDERADPMSMHDLQSSFWEARTRRERIDEEIAQQSVQLANAEVPEHAVAFNFYAVSENALNMENLAFDIANNKVLRPVTSLRIYSVASAAGRPSNAHEWMPTSTGIEMRSNDDSGLGQSRWAVDERGTVSFQGWVLSLNRHETDKRLIAAAWLLKSVGHLVALSEIIGEYAGSSVVWIVGGSIRADHATALHRDGLIFGKQPTFQGIAPIRPRRFQPTFEKPSVVPLCSAIWQTFHQLSTDISAFNEGYEEMRQLSFSNN